MRRTWSLDNSPLTALNNMLAWGSARNRNQVAPVVPNRAVITLLKRLAWAATVAVLLVVLGLQVFRTAYAGKVLPGVVVGDTPIGGLTAEEARSRLDERAAAFAATRVRFQFGQQIWEPTLGELGASVDVERSLAAGERVGREQEALDRLDSTVELFQSDQVRPFVIVLDRRVLELWFDRVDQDLGLPPHDAYLQLDGTKVTVIPEVDGTIVDRDLAYKVVLSSVNALAGRDQALPVVPRIAKVRNGDLESAKAQIESALSRDIEVTFERSSWTVSPKDFAPFIRQSADPATYGPQAVVVSVDEDALAKWLGSQFAGQINREEIDATVGWNQGLVSVVSSTNGIRVKPKTFARAVAASFFDDHGDVEVPVVTIRPDVDSENLDALGIAVELGRGSSSFYNSSPDRSTNIGVGATLLNGTLVRPGEEFSFNHSIGEISTALGFVESGVIQNARVDVGIGGGICQVSTTVFRAALYAGLPITEWWPHDYRLGFYELDGWQPGFDASILQPDGNPFSGGDFKFVNPSPDAWLLVESWVSGESIVVIIYGPDLGYTVEISGAEFGAKFPSEPDLELVDDTLPAGTISHTEYPQEGLEVWFFRTVSGPGGEIIEDHRQFYIRFKARGNVYWVSPDMKFQSPVHVN